MGLEAGAGAVQPDQGGHGAVMDGGCGSSGLLTGWDHSFGGWPGERRGSGFGVICRWLTWRNASQARYWRVRTQRAGQVIQQGAAGPEVGPSGAYFLARDEFDGGGGSGPVIDVQLHPHRRAQRPAGQADLDPAGAEVRVVSGWAAQHAVAQAQVTFAGCELPAFQRGDPGRERDGHNPPERQRAGHRGHARAVVFPCQGLRRARWLEWATEARVAAHDDSFPMAGGRLGGVGAAATCGVIGAASLPSRVSAPRPAAGWRSSSPLRSGGAGTTGTGAVRRQSRRPSSPAVAGGRVQPGRALGLARPPPLGRAAGCGGRYLVTDDSGTSWSPRFGVEVVIVNGDRLVCRRHQFVTGGRCWPGRGGIIAVRESHEFPDHRSDSS
jgi:hypothetical protein